MSSVKKNSRQSWQVCLLSALFFFYIFIQMNSFNAIEPYFFAQYGWTTDQLTRLFEMYFYGNVLFLFPAGMLLDRFSTRRLLLICMSVSLLCTLAFVHSGVIWQSTLARFVMGLAGAFCVLAPVRLASRWFTPDKMALVVGLIVTIGMIGGMVAQAPFVWLTQHYGFQSLLYVDTALGLLILFFLFAWVKDVPAGAEESEADAHQAVEGMGLFTSIGLVLRRKENWLAGLYASLINLPVFWLGGFWGVNYLHQAHHLTTADASMVNTMMFLGLIIGSPLYGYWSDKLCLRRLPLIVGALSSLFVMSFIIFTPGLAFGELFLLFFLLGVAISSQTVVYPYVVEANPFHLTGTAESIASVLIMAGGFTSSLFTRALNIEGVRAYVNKVPVYSVGSYHLALSLLLAGFILSLLISIALRESHCRPFDQ